jgi:hypothetical protein
MLKTQSLYLQQIDVASDHSNLLALANAYMLALASQTRTRGSKMSDIRNYQVDHLLLLVGSNPLPNAVAGRLLTTTRGAITFIHSHAKDSLALAQRLKSWFLEEGYSDTNIGFKEVEESDATSVYESVQKVLKAYEHLYKKASMTHMPRVGLNYTGGTKVMSVQAHRALQDWDQKHEKDAVFSYLDARTLQMRFEGAPGREAISFPVGLEVDISISDLLRLHNWQLIKDLPSTVPILPKSAKALLAVHSNLTEANIWMKWLHDELFRKAKKRIAIPPPFWVYESGEELQEQYTVKQPGNWENKTILREVTLAWPDLPNLEKAMRDELEQSGSGDFPITAGTGPSRCKHEEDFCKWLHGIWLESAVLSVLRNCSQTLHLKECCMDIKPKILGGSGGGELFQFDVVAMRGYQLFAFSCTTENGQGSGGRGILKQKLFEAYIRARQMGGDEACAALVCCAKQEEANKLEVELRRDISQEKRIRIFGRESLIDLTENIEGWISEQSKEN